jgi:hypothetical protein
MTNKKISELNAASTLAGTEVLPVVQSSATVKATVNQVLANLSASNLTSGTVPLARLSGITASQIANATITATQIANATITATQIANATITDTQVSASAAIALSKIAFPSQSGNADKVLKTDGTSTISWGYPEQCFIVALSDETTAITTGIKLTMLAPFAFTLKDVRGVLTEASSSGTVTVDIHKNGTTVMSTDKIEIEATETDSDDATDQPAITTSSFADGDKIEFEVDGAGTGAKGLKVYLYYVRS